MFTDHFPQKSSVIGGSFAGNNLHLQAAYESLPPCAVSFPGTKKILGNPSLFAGISMK